MKRIIPVLSLMSLMAIGCNNMSKTGENMTDEGTVQTNRVNADMEQHEVPAGTDTIISPGSNSLELKNGQKTSTGSTGTSGSTSVGANSQNGGETDKNMQNQDGTHGKAVNEGDNGGKK